MCTWATSSLTSAARKVLPAKPLMRHPAKDRDLKFEDKTCTRDTRLEEWQKRLNLSNVRVVPIELLDATRLETPQTIR